MAEGLLCVSTLPQTAQPSDVLTNGFTHRVYEINWKLADDKVNSTPPYNRVNKSNIRVGVRLPLTKDN